MVICFPAASLSRSYSLGNFGLVFAFPSKSDFERVSISALSSSHRSLIAFLSISVHRYLPIPCPSYIITISPSSIQALYSCIQSSHPPIHPSIHSRTHPPTCLSICSSVHPSIYSFVHSPAYPPIHPSIHV